MEAKQLQALVEKWKGGAGVKCYFCRELGIACSQHKAAKDCADELEALLAAQGGQVEQSSSKKEVAEGAAMPSRFEALSDNSALLKVTALGIYNEHALDKAPQEYPARTICKCGYSYEVKDFQHLQLVWTLHMIDCAIAAPPVQGAPYKGPINQPCSACSAGDTAMEHHDHGYVKPENRRQPVQEAAGTALAAQEKPNVQR